MSSTETHLDRRAMLRGAIRYPLLAGLGLLGARLVTGGDRPLQAGQSCTGRGRCKGCSRAGGCGLPQAALAGQDRRF